ncbi:uncharacterized protein HMPREF1541_09458 [Cyphellophora europaea CBS 101466]|uniref:Zn(2)-C6 fungal-type domain-containing protein n=1 Tax=Cyphellophora europaea (strain CBS 101466) TaxID=1220924 RepID=W2SA67_CYPE1|nr:uncharacterized protein HMPREF1541_09458 [Cyphellophora europaea CBS 101466]ETN45626.1 hypothetical protein HMPREF1541_09458 [Cyphellophora europaea CBS 101466]
MPKAAGVLVLRKACVSCTKSKRRCIVQLPKCVRCASKNISCVFELQPLVKDNTTAAAQALPDLAITTSANGPCCSTLCWLDLVSRPEFADRIKLVRMDHGLMHLSPAHPAMEIQVDPETENYLMNELQRIPSLAAAGQINAFIHPKLRMKNVRDHVDVILAACRGDEQLEHSFKDLVQTEVAKEDLEGLLAAVQSLMLYLVIALNGPDSTNRAWGEGLLPLLKNWIEALLISAREKMPQHHSPWRSWILAESVRRTIIVGFVIGCAFQHVRLGYCVHKLFVESLPFDARPGLWVARSPQAWSASAGHSIGAKVGEQLTSFHDFALSYPHVSESANHDPLQRIILVAHYGKWRIVERMG